MFWKQETGAKLNGAAFFLLDLALVVLMLFLSEYFLSMQIMGIVSHENETPVLYEKRDGYCPDTFHVAIRDVFFDGQFCTLGIRSKRKLSKEDLRVEPFVYRGRRFGRITITEDPFAAPGSDGVWNLLFKIDFEEDKPPSFFSRIDFAGMCPWKLERTGTSVVIRLNPAAREYVSRVAIPVCKGIARRDILCAEHDDPQTEAIRAERRSAFRLLLHCCAAFCIAANFFLYFRFWSRNPGDRPGIRVFGKQWAVFMLAVVLAFSVCLIVCLLILLSESLLRAGSMQLSDLQGLYQPVNISMAVCMAVSAGVAVFLPYRRNRRGPEAHLLPWLPLLCIVALTCFAVRNQFARHYFRELFRATVYHVEEDGGPDAETDPFAEARKAFDP